FSPRCWATSRTRRLPLLSVSRALRIAGRGPSKVTSTTAPMTWLTRPTEPVAATVLVAALAICRTSFLERLGARNDFDQFLGDLRLTLAVVLQRQTLDHLAGIAGRVVHGAHLGTEERGIVLEQRPEHLDRNIARQKLVEDRFL